MMTRQSRSRKQTPPESISRTVASPFRWESRDCRRGGRKFGNFRVRAYYRPETSRQSASLVRDGVVELIGRMRVGSQITLRSIFSKTFAKGRELPIVPEEVAADPRLQGLEVTPAHRRQRLVWIGRWAGASPSGPWRTVRHPRRSSRGR